MNLIEKLGLEKCKAIVSGAQVSDGLYDLIQNKYISWEDSSIGMVFMLSRFIDIADLRAAIADHDRTDYVSDISYHLSPLTRVIEK